MMSGDEMLYVGKRENGGRERERGRGRGRHKKKKDPRWSSDYNAKVFIRWIEVSKMEKDYGVSGESCAAKKSLRCPTTGGSFTS